MKDSIGEVFVEREGALPQGSLPGLLQIDLSTFAPTDLSFTEAEGRLRSGRVHPRKNSTFRDRPRAGVVTGRVCVCTCWRMFRPHSGGRTSVSVNR